MVVFGFFVFQVDYARGINLLGSIGERAFRRLTQSSRLRVSVMPRGAKRRGEGARWLPASCKLSRSRPWDSERSLHPFPSFSSRIAGLRPIQRLLGGKHRRPSTSGSDPTETENFSRFLEFAFYECSNSARLGHVCARTCVYVCTYFAYALYPAVSSLWQCVPKAAIPAERLAIAKLD